MRAKLIDGQLVYAPSVVIYENVQYIPAPDEILAKLGYKTIVYTPAPTCELDHHAESSWMEDAENISQVWVIVEDSSAEKCASRREWFDVNYRKWNEMLTRDAALGITETIVDNYRDKAYTTLAELYAEAEVVRAEIHAMENPASTDEA